MNKLFTRVLQAGRKLIEASHIKRSGPFVALTKYRSGSALGKLGRHVFEHKWIHRVLGSNLALAAVATSVLQASPGISAIEAADTPNMVMKAEKVNFITNRGLQYPVLNVKINQTYRWFHPGIDLEGETGDPVKPIMPGRVQSTQYSRYAYGNAVIVNHGNGVTTLYAHLSKITVDPGEEVNLSSQLGLVGSTGRSTGDHLHLEVREDGKALNPLSILPRL